MALPGQPSPEYINGTIVAGEKLIALQRFFSTFEKTFNCTVLIWAVMGSRRWGFYGPDSDYDINFVYAYPDERHWVQEGLPHKDFMYKHGPFEFHGWELGNWLTFLRKSNTFPSEMLWLQHHGIGSPSMGKLKEIIIEDHFNPFPQWHHHAAIVRKEFAKLSGELTAPGERIKSFLYATRSVAQCIWLHRQASNMFGPRPFGCFDVPHSNLAGLLWQSGRYDILPDSIAAHVQLLTLARNKGLEQDTSLNEGTLSHLMAIYAENSTPPPEPTSNRFGFPIRLNNFMLDIQRDLPPRYDHRFIEGGLETFTQNLEPATDENVV